MWDAEPSRGLPETHDKHASRDLHGLSAHNAVGAEVVVVRAPKSGASFWNLGNFSQQMENARARTALALEQLPDAEQYAN